MKKISTLKLAAAMAVLLTVAACSEKQETRTPSVISVGQTEFNVRTEGGTFTVTYSVASPVEGEVPEAICPESWVGSWEYNTQDSTITFKVEPNSGNDRQTTVSVIYGDAQTPAEFTVYQSNPNKIFAEDLEGTAWTAMTCTFDRNETLFHGINPEYPSEFLFDFNLGEYGEYVVITAGEFADRYAMDWNQDINNQDNLISANDVLVFDFSEVVQGVTCYYNVSFANGVLDIHDGQVTPVGSAKVQRILGKYTYDEATGLITVTDEANELYEREVVIQIRKDGEDMLLNVIETWWPDYLAEHIGYNDRFGFNLYNYDGTEIYLPAGELTYRLKKQ